MSLEVIYVTRHGFRSAWSVDHVTGTYTAHLRSPTGLPTDPALTSHGVEQASELAEHLIAVDPPIDRVYSSPYYRCLQTISPFVSRHNALKVNPNLSPLEDNNDPDSHMRIRVESGLSEWYGRAHFEHPTAAPLNDLSVLFADLDAGYVSSPAPLRHGESIPQLYERVASCIQAIITQCDQEGKRAVLVCTHAAVVIALGRILTGKVPEDPTVEDFGAFTCGLGIYRRQGVRENGAAKGNGPEERCVENGKEIQAGGSWSVSRPHPRARPAAESREPSTQSFDDPLQTRDFSISSHWTCEANSDCSFLSGGEERGWKFSGDESFVEIDRESLQPSSLKSNPNPANEKERNALEGAGTPKL